MLNRSIDSLCDAARWKKFSIKTTRQQMIFLLLSDDWACFLGCPWILLLWLFLYLRTILGTIDHWSFLLPAFPTDQQFLQLSSKHLSNKEKNISSSKDVLRQTQTQISYLNNIEYIVSEKRATTVHSTRFSVVAHTM